MPSRVEVTEQVRHRNTAIRPFGQQPLQADKALGDEVPVFDVLVKQVAHQIQVLHRAGMGAEAVDQVSLDRSLGREFVLPQMRIGNEEDHC